MSNISMSYFSWRASGLSIIVELEHDTVRMETAAAINADFSRIDLDNYTSLILDLSKGKFFDSSGIGWLLSLAKRCRNNGMGFVVVAQEETLLHLLKVTRVDSFIKIVQGLDEAKQAL